MELSSRRKSLLYFFFLGLLISSSSILLSLFGTQITKCLARHKNLSLFDLRPRAVLKTSGTVSQNTDLFSYWYQHLKFYSCDILGLHVVYDPTSLRVEECSTENYFSTNKQGRSCLLKNFMLKISLEQRLKKTHIRLVSPELERKSVH